MACLFGHKWDGCKCSKCGATRDEQHNWNGCKCSRCGKVRNEQHTWGMRNDYTRNCKCTRCGKAITVQDIDKITDQSVLGIIAEYADNVVSNVCRIALNKLTDQKILADLAKKQYGYNFLSEVALEKVFDQTMLIDISESARSEEVRAKATEKAAGRVTDIHKKLEYMPTNNVSKEYSPFRCPKCGAEYNSNSNAVEYNEHWYRCRICGSSGFYN